MHGAEWRRWGGVIVALLALSNWGCQSTSEHGDTTAARADSVPKTRERAAPSSAAIVVAAESLYTYGPERPQITVKDADFPGPYVPDDSLPRMSIATAALKEGVKRPAERIIARIRSDRPYPKAGIGKGYNYVWRSSWDTSSAKSWITKIVSRESRIEPHVLTRDARNHEYTHGDPKEPRLVRVKVHSMGFGACFDDPMCPTGHCGYY